MALVTVIVPTYNAARTLSDALRSLQAQTMKDWEAVVVDNFSVDGSYRIAEGFEDPRIRAVRRPSNRAEAVNVGVRLASGAYVANLDADDYWLPDFLERCVGALEAEQAGGGAVHSGAYTDFIEWQEEPWGGMKRVRRAPDHDHGRLLRENYVCASAFVARRPFWFEPRWEPVSDWEAVIGASCRGPLMHIPETLAVHRIHHGQWSRRSRTRVATKSFLLSFRHSPMAGLWRIREAVLWPIWEAIR